MDSRVFIVLIILFCTGTNKAVRAGDGVIQPEDFATGSQIIYAETLEIEAGIRGKVIKKADLEAGKVTGNDSVELPAELIEQYLERDVPHREVELYKDGKEPAPETLAEAIRKDNQDRAALVEKTRAAYQAAGLMPDPKTETIVHFYFGKARMQIIESLKGSLKAGDEVSVVWENVQQMEGSPAILPWKGRQVWMIDEAAVAGGTAKLIAGYYADLEMAKTAQKDFLEKEKAANL